MTCKDAIDVIADFLDQTLSADVGRELERHLAGCEPCIAYLNTYRKTRSLVGALGQTEMPPELRVRLRQFLLGQFGPPVC
jgi:anti-sigma factor (TIGR02949 family)